MAKEADKVSKHLLTHYEKLVGPWISKKNGYEKEFCDIVGFSINRNRYWDCEFKDIRIELKKGKSAVWLDEIRYAEVLLKMSEEAMKKTITVFFKYAKDTLKNILFINTKKLIKEMDLTKEDAEFLIKRFKKAKSLKHGLNSQHSISYSQLVKISEFVIDAN